jgi:UDP-glucose 4-epimerase
MPDPRSILITGGAGFIGSNVAVSLAAQGREVRVLDDLSTGSASNLEEAGAEVELRTGDVRDRDAIRRAVAGCDVVFHFAALPRVARSIADPSGTHDVNVTGTLNVLLAARDAGVRRVVYASSSSIYGDTPTLPKHEDMAPLPRSPYAAGKLSGEAYCRAFASVYALETVALRFFNVFGPRQDPTSEYAAVIPRFITRMLAGQHPQIYGDGRQSRDFTYIDNVVDGCVRAAAGGPESSGQVMNVACGERITLLDLVAAINRLLETNLAPELAEPRAGDVRHSLAAIEKAAELIGYRPSVSVYDGLARTVTWFTARRPAAEVAR